MALKKETADALKAKFGLDVDKLVAAIKADTETDYELPDVVVMSQTDLTTRDNNMKEEGKKAAQTTTETTVKAALIKELGKKLNTEFKSDRLGDLANEIQEFTNKSGDEKVKLLQQQVKALTDDKETLAKDVETQKAKAHQASLDAELISYFPAGRTGDLTDTDRLNIVKANLQFETVDGKIVVKKGGTALLDDTTKAPKAVKDAIGDFFKEKPSLVGTAAAGAGGAGGRGGGDNFGGSGGAGGLKKFSDAKAQWTKDNPDGNITSPEFTDYVGKLADENKDFDWNS